MPTILRLITGEYVLAQVKDEDDHYVISKAVILAIAPAQDGKMSVAMMPFCPFTKTPEIDIPKSAVLFVAEPETDIANHYSTQFGSGIVTAGGLPTGGPLPFPGT